MKTNLNDNTALHSEATMKPKWSCTICGMFSSRRYSVSRHIDNIHSGNGTLVPFVEYLAGRRSGNYPPGPIPSFANTEVFELDRMVKDVEQLFRKRVVEECLPPPGDPRYRDLAKIANNAVFMRFRKKLSELIREEISQLDSMNDFNNEPGGKGKLDVTPSLG